MDRHSGMFPVGVSGNPSGKPKSVFSTQEQVAGALMERYTPGQILDIAGDPKKLDKLGTWSAVVMLQLANMLKSHEDLDFAIERERMLDRVVGKAVSRTELTGKDGAALQINVITGVDAIDAAFVEVEPEQIEDHSSPAPAISEEEILERKRAYAREYARKYREKLKGEPSFEQKMRDKASPRMTSNKRAKSTRA